MYDNEEMHDVRVLYTAFERWAVFGKVVVSSNQVKDKNVGDFNFELFANKNSVLLFNDWLINNEENLIAIFFFNDFIRDDYYI